MTLMLYLITLSGEIILKSESSRRRFVKKLIDNIKDCLSRCGVQRFNYRFVNAKILLDVDKDVSTSLMRVFGVYRVAEVKNYFFSDLKDLTNFIAKNSVDKVVGRKFSVRVKRSGEHPFTSIDVAREVGSLLKPHSKGVDLNNPDVEVKAEIYGSEALLVEKDIKGVGGLPLGTGGRALSLFSGGFDSPVASWLIAKRGVYVDFLHYYMGVPSSTYYAFLVAKKLAEEWFYGYRPRFILMDFRNIIDKIRLNVEHYYRQVVLRALMLIIAEKYSLKNGYRAVVTGESIGQASSQTLSNITAIDRAVNLKVTVLRPLLGYDKEEIIDISRTIGLYDYSSKVTEACVIARGKVATAGDEKTIGRYLELFSEKDVDETVKTATVFDALSSKPEEVLGGEVEIDFIPNDAVVVDARDYNKYVSKHIPGSIHLSQLDLKSIEGKTIVFYCDTGYLSTKMANEFRRNGFKAYSLKPSCLKLS